MREPFLSEKAGAAPTPVPLRGMAGGQKFLPPNPFLFARLLEEKIFCDDAVYIKYNISEQN